MKNKNIIFSQIQEITKILIKESLINHQNYPKEINNEIVWIWYSWISEYLKLDKYSEIYSKIDNSSNYNLRFLDGWIIQMMYRFDNNWNDLLEHRLSFYPNIDFIEQNNDQEEDIYWLRKFWDLIYQDNIVSPIRFDYNSDNNIFKEYEHSYSHATIGWYKNCRISVFWPLTPFDFIDFILKSFYFQIYKDIFLWKDILKSSFYFNENITDLEKTKIHFNLISV